MASPFRTKAVVQRGDTLLEEEVTLPSLEPYELLIRVDTAALNPTDMLAFGLQAFGDGAVLGCDLAGTVEQTGSEVSRFSVGDKVASFIWGGERPGVGAFSNHCIVDERISFQVPSNISMAEASTIPLSATTAFLALFSKDCLGLDQINPPSAPLLVMGGSTSVGAFTNQIAATHNIPTVATCRAVNNETVKRYGAQATFDYTQPDDLEKLTEQYSNITHVFDTVGNPTSVSTGSDFLGSRDSKWCTVRPGKVGTENLPSNIDVHDVFVFTVFPKEHTYRGKAHWPINHQNFEVGKSFHQKLTELVSSGEIRPRSVLSLGTLSPESVTKGIEMLKEGKVSCQKICFTLPMGT